MAVNLIREVVEVTIEGVGISKHQLDRQEADKLIRELIPQVPRRSSVITLVPLGTGTSTTIAKPAKMPVSSRPNVESIMNNVDRALSKGRPVQLFRHPH